MLIEPGHGCIQAQGLHAGSPECRAIPASPQRGKGVAQMEAQQLVAGVQPTPPAAAGIPARLSHQRDGIEREPGEQQQQELLLECPPIPATGRHTGGKPGAGAPTSRAKVARDRDRVPDPALPVGLTTIVPMTMGSASAAMGTTGGAIGFRRVCQSDGVLLQGMNARYNPVRGSVLRCS